jgi:hypothetical protein
MQEKHLPLKIGLMVDSESASIYTYELAEWGQRQSNLIISHLIIQNHKQTPLGKIGICVRSLKRNGLLYLLSQISFSLITKIESLRLRISDVHKDHFKNYNLKNVISQSVYIEPQISKSGFVYRHSNENIYSVKSLNLDLIIKCCSGILRGEILNSSKLGLISLNYADTRIIRGGPEAFWEVYLKHEATGFVIQQLTEELDGGNVLMRGRFPTRNFYLLNQASLFRKSNYYLLSLLNEIAITRSLPPSKESQPYFNKLFKMPNLANQFTYTSGQAASIAKKIATRFLLRKDYRFGVAFARSDWKNLVLWRSNRIENPPNHFLADPFVVTEGGGDFCFVEDYDYQTRKGCISVYELKVKTAERLGEAIVEPFHMSFPYIFRFEEKLYMCPETAENGDIRLYECVNFPLQWKLVKTLMENVSAADTMIFEKDGLWWLFTNIDPVKTNDHCSELYLFYSENPLSNDWTSHRKNPLFIDSFKARNAGILFHEGSIFRVAQKQGFMIYGKQVSINKIDILTKQDYCESKFCSVEPNFFANIKGTHHLHSNNCVSVFDYLEIATISK